MEIGTMYEFPPLEGKFSKFDDLATCICEKLPLHPEIDKVYILHNTEQKNTQSDGWSWGKANKSNKANFANKPGSQKAVKYKCAVKDCPAVKFVDVALEFDMTRTYYDQRHKHKKLSSVVSKDQKMLNAELDSSGDDDFVNPNKQFKRKLNSDDGPRSKLPQCDTELNESLHFNPEITSTPIARKNMNGSNIANPMVTSDDLSKRNPVAADPDSTSHQSAVRSENKRLKATLVTSATDIASMLKENEIIKEEVKKNDALLGSLKKQNTVLNQNLSIVRKDAEKLRSDNLILENSVKVSKGEVET